MIAQSETQARMEILRAYRYFREQGYSPQSAISIVASNANNDARLYPTCDLAVWVRVRIHLSKLAAGYLGLLRSKLLSEAPSNVYWYEGRTRERILSARG